MSARQIPVGAPKELPRGAKVYRRKRKTDEDNKLAAEQSSRIGWYVYEGKHLPYQWNEFKQMWRVVRSSQSNTTKCPCDCGDCDPNDHDNPHHPRKLLMCLEGTGS